jgi:hypothetical protein
MVFLFCATPLLWSATWQEDFERVCGATEKADAMSLEELKSALQETDHLLEVIEKEGGPQKKPYLFRLNKCRNFFVYMIGVKESEKVKE